MGISNRPQLSLVIVSYNTVDLTIACIKSIYNNGMLKQTQILNQVQDSFPTRARSSDQHDGKGLSLELIIVDNASQDDSVKTVKQLMQNQSIIKNWQVIENKNNVGFAQANNQAIKVAQGEYILLLNSDTVVQPKAIENLLKFAQKSDPSIGLIASSLLNPDGTYQPQGGSFPSLPTLAIQQFFLDDLPLIGRFLPSLQYRYRPAEDVQNVDWVGGTALLIKRSVIDKIGLLDKSIFMYAEDIDYCYRARQAGFRATIYHQSQITHLGSGSSSSANAIQGEVRGVLSFFKKYRSAWQLPISKVIIWSGSLFRQLLFEWLGQPERARIYQALRARI